MRHCFSPLSSQDIVKSKHECIKKYETIDDSDIHRANALSDGYELFVGCLWHIFHLARYNLQLSLVKSLKKNSLTYIVTLSLYNLMRSSNLFAEIRNFQKKTLACDSDSLKI